MYPKYLVTPKKWRLEVSLSKLSFSGAGASICWVASRGELIGGHLYLLNRRRPRSSIDTQDSEYAGVVVVADAPRVEAAEAVAALRAEGVRCGMLTGDNPGAAASIAQQVGLDAADVYASLLPRDKLAKVCSRPAVSPRSPAEEATQSGS